MALALHRPNSSGIIRRLLCFEAVARHRSVKQAAEELGVSQSAISHQLRELTKELGEKLVVRSGRGVAITPKGEELAERLADNFANLQTSVDDIIGGGRQLLRLAVCSSFGPGWLIPRLANFCERNPHLDLQMQLYAQDPFMSDQVADAIVTARPVEPGFAAMHIFEETLVAVHAPGQRGTRHRLITTDINPGKIGHDWSSYCDIAHLQIADIQSESWLRCTHYLLALEMARAGLGIALVPDFLAKRDVERRVLAYFGSTKVPSHRAYSLCFKHSRGHEPGIKALVLWLKDELNPGRGITFEAGRSS